MGLAINYDLSAPNTLPIRTVRSWLEQTRAFALELGCKEVDPVLKAGPKYGLGRRLLSDPRRTGIESLLGYLDPRRGYAVEIWPGEGCESAHFGLCQYPRRVNYYGRVCRPEFARGWAFSGMCKTQYAHEHGWEHFLWCHRTIIRLLEFLRDLGMGVEVRDEGEYWETRSEDKLRAALGCYDRFMAAVAGACKDVAGAAAPGLAVESPIFARKDFEKLEAEGWPEIGRQLSKPSSPP